MRRIGRMLLVLLAVSLPLIGLGAGSASAGDSQVTTSGSLTGLDTHTFTVNCANNGGYVKGVGNNKTEPWQQVAFQRNGTLNHNIVYVKVAKNTEAFAFLSRAVTSMDVTVTHVAPFITNDWEVDYMCTSNIRDAWRVLG